MAYYTNNVLNCWPEREPKARSKRTFDLEREGCIVLALISAKPACFRTGNSGFLSVHAQCKLFLWTRFQPCTLFTRAMLVTDKKCTGWVIITRIRGIKREVAFKQALWDDDI